MKYQKYIKSFLSDKKRTDMATVAVIGGVAVGIAIGALFATKRGRATKHKIISFFSKITGKSINNKNAQLGNVIADVRHHVKENAEGLLGDLPKDKKVKNIKLENVTSKWKNQDEKSVFPNEPIND